nr:hypothetical protein [Tanacetum cinerariifolium]
MEVESPLVVKETVEKEKLSLVVNTFDSGSYPPLPTQETTSAGNALGRSSYARAMIKLRADVELKDNIVAAMPKINWGRLLYLGNKPFEVLTSVENDEELGTNRGASNLTSKATNSSGSSFWNAESSSPSTTPTIEKINKMENLIIDGKAILVNDEGKPLRKVDEDSEDEVASDDNEMASFLAKRMAMVHKVCLSNGRILTSLMTMNMTHTMIDMYE